MNNRETTRRVGKNESEFFFRGDTARLCLVKERSKTRVGQAIQKGKKSYIKREKNNWDLFGDGYLRQGAKRRHD